MAAKPDPVDVHVGRRLRLQRTLRGLSQQKLGEAVGLTFQQVQKYERGANRIGASRLHQFAKVLAVPISYFFEEMSAEIESGEAPRGGFGEELAAFGETPGQTLAALEKRETLELVRTYARIRDPEVRHKLFELAKLLAGIDGRTRR